MNLQLLSTHVWLVWLYIIIKKILDQFFHQLTLIPIDFL